MTGDELSEDILRRARADYIDPEVDEFFVELSSKRSRVEWLKGVVETLWFECADEDDIEDAKALRLLQRRAVEELLPAVTLRAERSDELWKAGLIR